MSTKTNLIVLLSAMTMLGLVSCSSSQNSVSNLDPEVKLFKLKKLAKTGNSKYISKYFSKDININKVGKDGMNVFHVAALYGTGHFIQSLIERAEKLGVEVDLTVKTDVKLCKTNYSCQGFEGLSAIEIAAKKGFRNTLSILFSEPGDFYVDNKYVRKNLKFRKAVVFDDDGDGKSVYKYIKENTRIPASTRWKIRKQYKEQLSEVGDWNSTHLEK